MESSSQAFPTLKFSSLLVSGKAFIEPESITLWHRYPPARAWVLFLRSLIILVIVVEAVLLFLGVKSGPGISLPYLRAAFLIVFIGALLPLHCPRKTQIFRSNNTARQGRYILGLVPAVSHNLDLEAYNALQVRVPKTLLSSLWPKATKPTRVWLVLNGAMDQKGMILLSGPRTAIVELARFMTLRHPKLGLRIEPEN